MKLLQINDYEWVNTDLITVISESESECQDCCLVRMLNEDFGRFCDRYNAQQLMSKICEEVYYGNDGIRKDD